MRAKRALAGSGAASKLVGLALAAGGLALVIAALPSVVWRCFLGVGLIILGWKLFIR